MFKYESENWHMLEDGLEAIVVQDGRRFIATYDDSSGHFFGHTALDGIETEKYYQEFPGRMYGVTHFAPLK
jgi:hypothetical protein